MKVVIKFPDFSKIIYQVKVILILYAGHSPQLGTQMFKIITLFRNPGVELQTLISLARLDKIIKQ